MHRAGNDAAQSITLTGSLGNHAFHFFNGHITVRAYLNDTGLDGNTQLLEQLDGHATSDDTSNCLAGRSTSATTRVADAIFDFPGEVGMVRTVATGNLVIVVATGIGPSVLPCQIPESTSTLSFSSRELAPMVCPVRRRATKRCNSSKSISTPAGIPSSTPPIAGPCDSPKVVSVNILPMVFIMSFRLSGQRSRLPQIQQAPEGQS